VSCLLIFTEYNTRASGSTAVIQYVDGSKDKNAHTPMDSAAPDSKKRMASPQQEKRDTVREKEKAPEQEETLISSEEGNPREPLMKNALPMTNTFSWQTLNYVISVGGGRRRKLLDDVSGYVSPGKLTALMGESGAGKVSN
jgi:ATP-binding cassette subfamily G (WHITE) protein 2 (SNQ2)